MTISGKNSLGGITGNMVTEKSITGCISSGQISGIDYIGGITGQQSRSSIISKCRNNAEITGNQYVGGLAGLHSGGILLSNSYGNIIGAEYVGGAVGFLSGSIVNSFAAGAVTGENYVGGLVGRGYNANIRNCYSIGYVQGNSEVGGLVGFYHPTPNFAYSYWDIDTSGQPTSAGGIGLTTTEMKMNATYHAWACDMLWTIDDGNDYPRLYWESDSRKLILDGWFAGGKGTEEEPFLVETADQLNLIGSVDCLLDKHYKLITDIDLKNYDGLADRPAFNIIGQYDSEDPSKAFSGTFDGDGHTINNFRHTSDSSNCIGIFGYTSGENSKIKNVGNYS